MTQYIRTFAFPGDDLSLETGVKRIAAKYGGKLISSGYGFGDRDLEFEFPTITKADMATIEIKSIIRKGNKKMAAKKKSKKRVYGPIRQKKRGRPKGSKNKKAGKKKAGKKKVGRKRKVGRPKGSKNKTRGVNALKVGKKGDSFLITIKKAG